MEFDGSADELTDRLWPDEEPDRHGMTAGYVMSIRRGNWNGWASHELWEWLESGPDAV